MQMIKIILFVFFIKRTTRCFEFKQRVVAILFIPFWLTFPIGTEKLTTKTILIQADR